LSKPQTTAKAIRGLAPKIFDQHYYILSIIGPLANYAGRYSINTRYGFLFMYKALCVPARNIACLIAGLQAISEYLGINYGMRVRRWSCYFV